MTRSLVDAVRLVNAIQPGVFCYLPFDTEWPTEPRYSNAYARDNARRFLTFAGSHRRILSPEHRQRFLVIPRFHLRGLPMDAEQCRRRARRYLILARQMTSPTHRATMIEM